jgi:hypothetical protein
MGPDTIPSVIPAVLTAALLVGVGMEARSRARPVGATQARVRGAAEASIPYSIGDWIASDVAAAPAAIALLRPNVLVSRAYQNLKTGETATLLFVQCSDARDLVGHYPPNCYPANGWTLEAAARRDWQVDGTTIQGMRYRFGGRAGDALSGTVVDNFMVLPTGEFGRDMDAVDRVAGDAGLRRLGAAEVQVLTDGKMSEERRDDVFRTLIGPAAPLFACVREGGCK